MAWRGWDNAEIYDAFVRRHRIYRRLNQKMVEMADLDRARRVLDLGCGTGATALACLRVLDPDAELIGVDASAEMVEVARANVFDPRASFVVAGAAGLADAVAAPFDRIVCNAAFWQFPSPGAVFRALAAVAGPGALVVWNVPAERVRGERPRIHPFQVALARAVEAATGSPIGSSPTAVDLDALRRVARDAGFATDPPVRLEYRGQQGELIELMSIPAMIRPLTPDLDDEERDALLDDARRRVDPEENVVVPWVYVIHRFVG